MDQARVLHDEEGAIGEVLLDLGDDPMLGLLGDARFRPTPGQWKDIIPTAAQAAQQLIVNGEDRSRFPITAVIDAGRCSSELARDVGTEKIHDSRRSRRT